MPGMEPSPPPSGREPDAPRRGLGETIGWGLVLLVAAVMLLVRLLGGGGGC